MKLPDIGKLPTDMNKHDARFKALLQHFFPEFLEAFATELYHHVNPNSVVFLDKETYAELLDPRRRDADIVVQAEIQGSNAMIVVHIEHQARAEAGFEQRMFHYFARLTERYQTVVYPIALLSYRYPQQSAVAQYYLQFAGQPILDFRFHVIQLNQLNWREYVTQANPVAIALATHMGVRKSERFQAKLAVMLQALQFRLNEDQQRILAGFIHTYLPLSQEEQAMVEQTIRTKYATDDTYWWLLFDEQSFKKGLAEGRQEGLAEGRQEGLAEGRQEGLAEGRQAQLNLVLRLLRKHLTVLPDAYIPRITRLAAAAIADLGVDLLDFDGLADLDQWLERHATTTADSEASEAGE